MAHTGPVLGSRHRQISESEASLVCRTDLVKKLIFFFHARCIDCHGIAGSPQSILRSFNPHSGAVSWTVLNSSLSTSSWMDGGLWNFAQCGARRGWGRIQSWPAGLRATQSSKSCMSHGNFSCSHI